MVTHALLELISLPGANNLILDANACWHLELNYALVDKRTC